MSATSNRLRIIVVYRADLPEMTRAKGEVQFGHAVASVLYHAMQADPELVRRYIKEDNQPKLSMEVPDLDALMKVRDKAEKRGINYFLVIDAAQTVFTEPTVTAIGLGPLSKTDGNALTRDAKIRE